MTARFLPFLIFWRAALFFLARPTAILLDWWLGVEGITYLHEREIHSVVARAAATGGDIGKLEATGVQNFLDLDDLPVTEEGEPIHAQSIISLPLASGRRPADIQSFTRRSFPSTGQRLWQEVGHRDRSRW